MLDTLWDAMLERVRGFEEVTSEKASKFFDLAQDELFAERCPPVGPVGLSAW